MSVGQSVIHVKERRSCMKTYTIKRCLMITLQGGWLNKTSVHICEGLATLIVYFDGLYDSVLRGSLKHE